MGEVVPAVLLVPGLWHGAWAWERVGSLLDERGIANRAISFPGQDRLPGDPSFDGHVEHLRRKIGEMEEPVVVVAHSYGGAVVSEAAEPGRVRAIVFVTAFALSPGESIADVMDAPTTDGGSVAADSIDIEDGLLVVDRETAMTGFYQDCDSPDAEDAFRRLTPEDRSTRVTKVTRAAWTEISSHFIICTADRAIPLHTQSMLADRVGSRSTIDSGHVPMLSRPRQLADLIEEAIGHYVAA